MPYWGGALCFRGEVKERILNGARTESAGSEPYAIVERHWRDADRLAGGADLFQEMTYLELKQRLPELLLMRLDKITMASSVEGREPFLDHQLVEFALALPPAMKYRRRHRQVCAQAGHERNSSARSALTTQAGFWHSDGGVDAR